MLTKTIDKYEFRLAFLNSETYKNQFSLNALDELFEFYENQDETVELDIVAIACDWIEYENIKDYNSDYSQSLKSWDEVCEQTLVLQLYGTDGALVLSY